MRLIGLVLALTKSSGPCSTHVTRSCDQSSSAELPPVCFDIPSAALYVREEPRPALPDLKLRANAGRWLVR